MRKGEGLALANYKLSDILPANEILASADPQQGDMLANVAENEGLSGEVIAVKNDLQFELLQEGNGDILVRHKTHGVLGVYIDNSLGVVGTWSGKGLGIALILYGYDYGKTPSSDRQFTDAGAAAMTKAMSVAKGDDVNPYWP